MKTARRPWRGPPAEGAGGSGDTRDPSAAAFDRLHVHSAHRLSGQLYLLTGDRMLARECVEHGFRQAWLRWPKVACDPDPESWIRAAACEYALSPWLPVLRCRLVRWCTERQPPRDTGRRHRLQKAGKGGAAPPRAGYRPFFRALARLTGPERYAVVLFDAVGLDLPGTAAEMQSTTAAAADRLSRAHTVLADALPRLRGGPSGRESTDELGGMLRQAASVHRIRQGPPEEIRKDAEHRARRLAQGTAVLAAALVLAVLASLALGLCTPPEDRHPPGVTGQRRQRAAGRPCRYHRTVHSPGRVPAGPHTRATRPHAHRRHLRPGGRPARCPWLRRPVSAPADARTWSVSRQAR